jgi:hypothetical protein
MDSIRPRARELACGAPSTVTSIPLRVIGRFFGIQSDAGGKRVQSLTVLPSICYQKEGKTARHSEASDKPQFADGMAPTRIGRDELFLWVWIILQCFGKRSGVSATRSLTFKN